MKNYPAAFFVTAPNALPQATFHPGGSKSLSNRALLIRHLAGENGTLEGLSISDDTQTMQALLNQSSDDYNTGPAGTSYRFMCAYLSTKPGTQILHGTERMHQRPIEPLVRALRQIGATIEYLEKPGYPPLKIGPPQWRETRTSVSVEAGISSQFISALMMIGPVLPHGLDIQLIPPVASESYVKMTAEVMKAFGADLSYVNHTIQIAPKPYSPTDYQVETDWSSAAYPIGLLALAGRGTIHIPGLVDHSLQGDQVIQEIAKGWGIKFEFSVEGLTAKSEGNTTLSDEWSFDFTNCPDLAPTVIAVQAARNIKSFFSGLDNLKFKESDRIEVMKSMLKQVGLRMELDAGAHPQAHYTLSGQFVPNDTLAIDPHGDHRMAMAFSLWAMKMPVLIKSPNVVSKSYPHYWEDLKRAGFAFRNV